MFLEEHNRRVLPRWRDFDTTLKLGELSNVKVPEPVSTDDRKIVTRRALEWRNSPTIWHAADLLNSAFVIGIEEESREAAEFILSNRSAAPAPLVSLAKQCARQIHSGNVARAEEQLSKLLHDVRVRLSDEPRNAIQWVELSRLYMLAGDSARALKAMTVAASVGPNSRFVVRCASRLFLHFRDAGRALSIIRNAMGAKKDPWLSCRRDRCSLGIPLTVLFSENREATKRR